MSTQAQVMKAIGIPKHGGIEVIEELSLSVPKPSPSGVLVKVQYGGVNFRDTYVRQGLYPSKTFPVILGQEAAGIVVQLPTDPVILESEKYKRLGLKEGCRVVTRSANSFAEYVASEWDQVSVVPDSIPTNIAVASVVQGLTALTFMTEAYNVQAGDWILIHTIAGGLGLIFCQIAKARGAHVIGTTSSKEKAELAKANGADHVILYTEENTVDRVLEITQGKGVIAIFDGVGKDTFEADFTMIARKGTLVSVGNASGAVPPFPPLKLIDKNVKLLRPTVANYIATADESYYYSTQLWELLTNGTVKIKIFKEYPFSVEGVKQSQIDIVGRGTTGKLLIKMP